MSNFDKKTVTAEWLLKNGPLKSVFGPNGEYQVCTSIIAWRSCCRVYRGDLELDEFPPVYLDLNAKIRHRGKMTKEMRSGLAKEIARMHFKRCKEVKQYVDLQMQRSKRRAKIKTLAFLTIFLIIILGVAFLFLSKKQKHALSFLPSVQWTTSFISSECKADSQCIIELPELKNGLKILPVDLTLVSEKEVPQWLAFDPATRRLNGRVPSNVLDAVHVFTVHAKTIFGPESILRIDLEIKGISSPPLPVSPAENGFINPKDILEKIDPECLRKKLQGESCD